MDKTIKQDHNKVRVDLVEPSFIMTIGKIMTYGIEEQGYVEGSWREVPDPINRYYAALMRHILAWRDGEKYDPQSGYHHLAHAGANVMILLWFEIRGKIKLRKEVKSNGRSKNI